MRKWIYAAMALCVMCACGGKGEKAESQTKEEAKTLSGLKPSDFVSEVDGKPTALYVLKNSQGAEACVTNWGGRLVSVMVPDRDGKLTDVVLGYDNIQQYVQFPDNNYGALIGRYGNRIANGQFQIDGQSYQLPQNNNGHCLHGGPKGYHAVTWDARQIDGQSVELTYLSPDGEAGFPGNLKVKVIYRLTDDNAIDIQYEATTDKPTIVNLTNHSYFNLSGVPGSTITDHKIQINADTYVPVDETLIPTGKIETVEGTPMDLRQLVTVGDHIDDDFAQLRYGGGYDHNWVLNTKGDLSAPAAKVVSEKSGIVMEVFTNEPGLQFYAGNSMSEAGDKGKLGVVYPRRGALCLETQHYPDSPNQKQFPSVVLQPGETYQSRCIYKFSR
ncbi:MAG TPA: galactose mutarotase [Candidatus Parabacteroides intestinipullorum]|uniref:Aldose 1-epimerase n=1 Tax=Candidatus Parabacteroides intestinipullorum TaxID=2838723 RepID=A0A9D2BGX0_9BACT|nr:galactose mutarotase [Candidatus Parabacteroides intestinipullorum]